MKDIIDGKRYDTDTAEEIATGSSSGAHPGDFEYYRETLYKTDNGAWFLAGKGGPKTKYASPVPGGGLSGGSGIHPLTSGETMSWMEAHSRLRALEKHFPDEIEDA